MSERNYTSKQMGDACEMLVAAEMTLAGIPAVKVPDNWPCYDLIAQPPGDGAPVRISVKARTFKAGGSDFVSYDVGDHFDWLAIVLLPGVGQVDRRIFIVPKSFADANARSYSPESKVSTLREFRIDEIETRLGLFKSNFRLLADPSRIAVAT